jgi:chromosome segregation ATPase
MRLSKELECVNELIDECSVELAIRKRQLNREEAKAKPCKVTLKRLHDEILTYELRLADSLVDLKQLEQRIDAEYEQAYYCQLT